LEKNDAIFASSVISSNGFGSGNPEIIHQNVVSRPRFVKAGNTSIGGEIGRNAHPL